MNNGTNGTFISGLEGVVAAQTKLSRVDGMAGELIIGGFAVEELAAQATFEGTVYLLWHGRLPTAPELSDFTSCMAMLRPLPAATLTLLENIAVENVPVMDALRMAAGTLSLDADEGDQEQLGLAIVARFAPVVAAYWRLRHGRQPINSDPGLRHAANFLFMLTGNQPGPAQIRGLETYWNTVIDHGLNASTFAARVIIATRSDLVSAVTGAVGALKGPLHGGAPGPALDTVF
ncbi:MAG TPA: citrate synthase/methylcitrate synthase, partial [Anaerolineae bacterium]|nr:citrate synthase/methylcitrate synthase [Anaerolineae bacterium]